MKIEEQVTSLDISNFLNQLGVKHPSIFVWEYFNKNCYAVKFQPFAVLPSKFNKYKLFPAYTASELGNILPNNITTKENEPFNNYRLCIAKFHSVDSDSEKLINNYIINYECDSTEIHGENAWLRRKLTNNIYDHNLANSMAKMYIYLMENGLIKNEVST